MPLRVPVPISATYEGIGAFHIVTFDDIVTIGGPGIAGWTARWNNFLRTFVLLTQESPTAVRITSIIGAADAGADVIGYNGALGNLVDFHNRPIASFTDYPVVAA